jgi:hypothetical protein
MCAAVAKWEAMKARAGGLKKAKLSSAQRKKLPASSNALARAAGKPEEKRVRGAVCRRYPSICSDLKKSAEQPETVESVSAVLDMLARDHEAEKESQVKKGLLFKIAKAVGLSDDELAEIEREDDEQEELAKRAVTFDELRAQNELDDELPKAFDALRSVVWRAFSPYCDEDEKRDPKDVISTSLDQFKDWAIDLIDRVPMSKEDGEEPDLDALVKAFGAAPEGLIPEGGTLDRNTEEETEMAWTDEEKQRVENLESGLGEVKTGIETLVKAHEESQKPEAPTVEDLAEKFDSLTGELQTLAKGIETLAEGDSAQGNEGDTQVQKSDPETIGLLG